MKTNNIGQLADREVLATEGKDMILTKIDGQFILITRDNIITSASFTNMVEFEDRFRKGHKQDLLHIMSVIAHNKFDFEQLQTRDLINNTFVPDEFCI